MDLIKKYWIFMVCGVVAALSLVGLAFGVMGFGNVTALMAQAQTQVNQLATLESGVLVEGKKLIPNEQAIEILKKKRNEVKNQFYDIVGESLRKNIGWKGQGDFRSKPLLAGVFPKPISAAQAYEFPSRYTQAFDDLLKQLKAGTPPNAQDIVNQIEIERRNWGFLMDDAKDQDRGGNEQLIRSRAREAAEIGRARSIKVYADINNFDILSDISAGSGRAPTVDRMWWAQMSLWIQQYLVDAIAEVNGSGKDVGDSVVKQIKQIAIEQSYISSAGPVGPGGSGRLGAAFPEGISNRTGNDLYDVLRFSITVVVDGTGLMEFIDAVYKQNFFTLYAWELASVDPAAQVTSSRNRDPASGGMRFGWSPVVTVQMYWEAYFLHDYYRHGIIGYGVDQESGKSYVDLLDGTKKTLKSPDDRSDLVGLMPTEIREMLGGGGGGGGEKRAKRGGRSGRRR